MPHQLSLRTRRRWRASLSFVAALCLVTNWTAAVFADDPVSSSVRFNREIIRILQRRCLPCHVPGGLAVPLNSYRQVRDWGRAIREELVEQRMPPGTVAPGYGRFENALGLTAREMTTLLTWLDGGMPRGEDRDLPASLDPVTGETPRDSSDLRLALPQQHVPAFEDLVIRRVTIDTRLPADRLVSRVVVRPGSPAILRGALVYEGQGERSWVGAWLPWQRAFAAPITHGFRLPKGARLSVVLFYRGGDEAAVDRSAVELHFADRARLPIESLRVDAAISTTTLGGERMGQLTLASATTIWALQPSAAHSTRSLELRARRPDLSMEVMLWVPAVRSEWPSAVVLQEPLVLPAGTVLTLSTYGGSAAAPPDHVILSTWRGQPRTKSPSE